MTHEHPRPLTLPERCRLAASGASEPRYELWMEAAAALERAARSEDERDLLLGWIVREGHGGWLTGVWHLDTTVFPAREAAAARLFEWLRTRADRTDDHGEAACNTC